MYRIQKSYYTGTDETKVRLTLQEPYRDFVVSFSGDLTNVEDDILEQRAIGKLAREFSPSKALEDLAKRQEEQEQSIKSILKTITLAKDLSKDQKEEILSRYDEYKVGKEYKEKDKFIFDGKIYEVIQEHRSQTTWIPSSTPSLYTEFLNVTIKDEAGNTSEVVAEFRQPTGAHDAYNKGDKVSFEGGIYESTVDSNTFSPSQYPEGWKKIG
ncbi:carbohydrate-binding protein [Anaerococcus tetradius]|uniref:Chitin-binding type-3 domain-containing protein n=1 Tax=Anaerococcus tetradius ATCC 35098 TaxID=525255 RepID=C2CFV6_9FIRM|nr:carbohydrate-binding protein [Anaerococcus tetradius]EEI83484.1 hypothetical protein HMPREF0077_0366 [Anaerococcus tetradius ATCC 35098]